MGGREEVERMGQTWRDETQCTCTMESTWKVHNPRSAFKLFLQEPVIKLMLILNDSLVYALHSKEDGLVWRILSGDEKRWLFQPEYGYTSCK